MHRNQATDCDTSLCASKRRHPETGFGQRSRNSRVEARCIEAATYDDCRDLASAQVVLTLVRLVRFSIITGLAESGCSASWASQLFWRTQGPRPQMLFWEPSVSTAMERQLQRERRWIPRLVRSNE